MGALKAGSSLDTSAMTRRSALFAGLGTMQLRPIQAHLRWLILIKDGITSFVNGPDGLPLEQITSAGVVHTYNHDQLGSTRVLTDSTGTIENTYSYDVYGNLIASAGTVSNALRFAGQYADGESSTYYLRARSYDPASSQFVSRDPLFGLTRSPYAYVLDSPLNRLDPTGLDQLSQNWEKLITRLSAGMDKCKEFVEDWNKYRETGDFAELEQHYTWFQGLRNNMNRNAAIVLDKSQEAYSTVEGYVDYLNDFDPRTPDVEPFTIVEDIGRGGGGGGGGGGEGGLLHQMM